MIIKYLLLFLLVAMPAIDLYGGCSCHDDDDVAILGSERRQERREDRRERREQRREDRQERRDDLQGDVEDFTDDVIDEAHEILD